MNFSNSNDEDFYRQLPQISNFSQINDLQSFYPAPDTWWVVITDVVNSTEAVSRGQYKQVNMVGASCITAVLNATKGIEIPYVFGGDGATLLIPAGVKQITQTALAQVRALSAQQFKLGLRIGFVSVKSIRQMGRDVLVAKHRISAGNFLAMFSGSGIELADKLIKQDESCERYALADTATSPTPDLNGLSCRWQPLASHNGRMICLLVQALDENLHTRHKILSSVLSEIGRILGHELSGSSPVTQRSLEFKWPPQGLKMEAQLTKGRQSVFRRYLYLLYQSFIQAVLERFGLAAGGYDAPVYRHEIQTNADYRRFDDALRLVLDCTVAQIDAIKQMLEQIHQQGRIAFGIHQTPKAQMTCLVFSLEQSEHIHFVDGSDGGFWAAAVQYKKQLSKSV